MTSKNEITGQRFICRNNQGAMVRDGLVTAFVTKYDESSAALVTYEKGQTNLTVYENFGKYR